MSKIIKKSDFMRDYFNLRSIHQLVYLGYESNHSYTISIMANWGGLRMHLKQAPFHRAENPYLGCHKVDFQGLKQDKKFHHFFPKFVCQNVFLDWIWILRLYSCFDNIGWRGAHELITIFDIQLRRCPTEAAQVKLLRREKKQISPK